MSSPYDCIIIGAGHNGLVCAAYLAGAGRKVLVLEAADSLGGAAATREFYPGYKASLAGSHVHMMPASVIKELDLASHGLAWASVDAPTTVLDSGGPFALDPQGIGVRSATDGRGYSDFAAQMRKFAAAIFPLLSSPPPRLGTGDLADSLSLARLGWQLKKLGKRDMRELLRIGGMNIYDLLEERLTLPALQGALALEATLGTNYGPRTPWTVLSFLYRLACEWASQRGACQPKGGMGALAEALGAKARSRGAHIRVGAAVQRIEVVDDRVAGVTLADGERLQSSCVISSADPKTTFLSLLGSAHLDTGFVRKIAHLRARGLAARLHLALDRAPQFTGVEAARLHGRLLLAPSMDYVERAFNHSKYRESSSAPAMEISVPSMSDPSLAPAGGHVLCVTLQYAPYDVNGGWDTARAEFERVALRLLGEHAPGIEQSVVGSELLTPCDIERTFRMHGGHWHHAEFAFDQFFMVRPVPGTAQYATPIHGLYLCGAGSHPGGGVTGIPGRNAAQRVIQRKAA